MLEHLFETTRLFQKFEENLPESALKGPLTMESPPIRGGQVGPYNKAASTAYYLIGSAHFLADLQKKLMEVTHDFNTILPQFSEGALSFYNFTKFVEPILHEMEKLVKEEKEMNAKIHKLEMKFEELTELLSMKNRDCEAHKKLLLEFMKGCHEMEDELGELGVTKYPKDKERVIKIPDQGVGQTSKDSRSVPVVQDKKAGVSSVWELTDDTLIRRPYTSNALDSNESEKHEVKEMKKKLEEAVQENAALQRDVERLKKTLYFDRFAPEGALHSRWLAWAQQLQDRPTVAARALIALQKKALQSDEELKYLENSLSKFKRTFDERPTAGFGEITG